MRILFFLFFFVPMWLSANFIGMNSGARLIALGNASTSISNEVTSIFNNPACQPYFGQYNLKGSHQNIFRLNNLFSDMIVISFPIFYFQMGIGFQQVLLKDTYSEQIFYFSSVFNFNYKNIPIHIGTSIKYESALLNVFENKKISSNYDMDIGTLIELTEDIFLGYSIKNLFQPEFKFYSAGDRLQKQHSIGISYCWEKTVYFLTDYKWTEFYSQWNFGSEIWFHDIFAARLGMMDQNLTAGFGLKTKYWDIDSAVISYDDLGSNYRISLGLKIGKENQK